MQSLDLRVEAGGCGLFMDRKPNWPAILAEKVEEWRNRPFDWVTWNCLLFPAAMVEALTGIDHRSTFPEFSTKQDALRIVTERGGIEALISSVLGESKAPSHAMRGDVVVCDFGEGITAGICLGLNCCAPGAQGLVFRRTLSAVAAWSV